MLKKIHTREIRQRLSELRAGDSLLLSGAVYTARDAAHRRMLSDMQCGAEPPFDLRDATIFYAGPTPPPPEMPIGSCGPTTAGRMDKFTPALIERGLVAMIGKGERHPDVVDAMIRHGAVYLCAIGGAGALAAKSVLKAEEIAYPDLGCESVKRLELLELPVFVAVDCRGKSLFRAI